MRKLEPPGLVAKEIYKSISESRREPRRQRLVASEAKILAAYEAYASAASQCALLDPIDVHPAKSTDLVSNYTYLNAARPEWRGALLAQTKAGKCPMCSVGRASTLDHYLPESVFPEFAILPINLIPACSLCQTNKRQLYQESDAPIFLQLYFADIPVEEQFLFADAKVIDGIVSLDYEVVPPTAMPAALAECLKSHFKRLRLREFYTDEGVGEFGSKRAEIKRLVMTGCSPEDVRLYLQREAATVADDLETTNHWRPVALNALADCPEVCSGAFR